MIVFGAVCFFECSMHWPLMLSCFTTLLDLPSHALFLPSYLFSVCVCLCYTFFSLPSLRRKTFCWTQIPTLKSQTSASVTSSRWAVSWTRSAAAPLTPPLSFSRARSMTGLRWISGAWESFCTRWSADHCPLMAKTSRWTSSLFDFSACSDCGSCFIGAWLRGAVWPRGYLGAVFLLSLLNSVPAKMFHTVSDYSDLKGFVKANQKYLLRHM